MKPALKMAFGRGHARKLAAGAAVVVASLTLAVGPALAAAPTVYRNIPTVLPGNVASQAFEATSTSEFGDLIQLAAGERTRVNLPVTVVMSSWGCETGGNATCTTTPGATWNQDLTLNIYSVKDVAGTPTVDALLLTKTQTFAIPYRPSYVPDGPCFQTFRAASTAGIRPPRTPATTGWPIRSPSPCPRAQICPTI